MDRHSHHHHQAVGDADTAEVGVQADILDLDAEVLSSYLTSAIDRVHDLARQLPVRRILDIGAGTGSAAVILAQRFAGADVVAVDQSAEMLARFARDTDMDVFMVAGRYTLLDQTGLAELLPLCVERGIAVVAVGVMNSGLLAEPRPGATFDYRPAPAALVERAIRLRDVCARHGVGLREAAIQFPLAHPAVVAVAAGIRTVAHFDDYPAALRASIPGDLWAELRSEGLLPADAPTPAP